MEEHVDTMVNEMKKKNKLLQGLMLKQDAGALASTDMDQNKVTFTNFQIFKKDFKNQIIPMQACNDED